MRVGVPSRCVVVAAALLFVGACADERSVEPEARRVVGFILVGDRDDLGYNQAAWEGMQAVARAFPDLDVVGVENVPETDRAVATLEDLVDRGAEILFATSFGHLDAAYEVADRHPDVVVVHQGGVEPEPRLDNFGTYFGTHAEAMYAAGVVAGGATDTGTLGFVAAFPIPATYNNVNAFLLGARRIRPEAAIDVVFTDSWCDVDSQRAAARRLIADGADVIAQHQDCTGTVLEEVELAGLHAVGYHSDGSEVAPTAWLTGAIWTWADLYVDIVAISERGAFTGSAYDGDFRGTLADGNNPFALTEFGPGVDPVAAQTAERSLVEFTSRTRSLFEGPLTDTAGGIRVAAGEELGVDEADTMDYFVAGVTTLDR